MGKSSWRHWSSCRERAGCPRRSDSGWPSPAAAAVPGAPPAAAAAPAGQGRALPVPPSHPPAAPAAKHPGRAEAAAPAPPPRGCGRPARPAGRVQAAGAGSGCRQRALPACLRGPAPEQSPRPPHLVALPLRQVPQAPQLHEHLVVGGAGPRGGACSGTGEHVKAARGPQPRWAQATQGRAGCRRASRAPGSAFGETRAALRGTHPAGRSPRRRSQPGEHPATCPRRGTGSGRTAPRGCSRPARSGPGSPCGAGGRGGCPVPGVPPAPSHPDPAQHRVPPHSPPR